MKDQECAESPVALKESPDSKTEREKLVRKRQSQQDYEL